MSWPRPRDGVCATKTSSTDIYLVSSIGNISLPNHSTLWHKPWLLTHNVPMLVDRLIIITLTAMHHHARTTAQHTMHLEG